MLISDITYTFFGYYRIPHVLFHSLTNTAVSKATFQSICGRPTKADAVCFYEEKKKIKEVYSTFKLIVHLKKTVHINFGFEPPLRQDFFVKDNTVHCRDTTLDWSNAYATKWMIIIIQIKGCTCKCSLHIYVTSPIVTTMIYVAVPVTYVSVCMRDSQQKAPH